MACFSMHLFVALSAQGDQILFHVPTGPATQFEVMHLQVLHAPRTPGIASRRAPAPADAVRGSWSHRV